MKVFQTDPTRWIAEGSYAGRFIVVEGKTRHQALFNWAQTASGGMAVPTVTQPGYAQDLGRAKRNQT